MEQPATNAITNVEHKWLSSPATIHKGKIDELRQYIPSFERRTFGPALLPVEQLNDTFDVHSAKGHGFNPLYDVIVRNPLVEGEVELPVGIVSPCYSLIQHLDIFDEVLRAVKTVKVDIKDIEAELLLTGYGERMRLRLKFPNDFGFEVKVGDRLAFTLECYNSIDGSMKFMVLVGWLRLVCSNGMVIQENDSSFRRRHNQYLQMQDIAAVLHEGIATTTRQQAIFKQWMRTKVSEEKLKKWVNQKLANSWGKKAAARAWHITLSGHDVQFADPFQKGAPTEKDVIPTVTVPGSILPGNNVYAVSQSLSWLAKERRDVQEQLEWKQQIPELLAPLCK
jgi:hypothetical protein